MSDTIESLQRKRNGAAELETVVRTMKAMAASNIGQYQMAVAALKDYYLTVQMGLNVWFMQNKQAMIKKPADSLQNETIVIVFGSDQGLVGSFNESLSEFVHQSVKNIPGQLTFWVVGQRMYDRLKDLGLPVIDLFDVPNSVSAITLLINAILVKAANAIEVNQLDAFYIFNNEISANKNYSPHFDRLWPLDEKWEKDIMKMEWPGNNLPQVTGDTTVTFEALVREYFFVSLYKACAELMASENESRLQAMQRAEKNIDEMLEDLKQTYNRLRQSTIDQELFDVIAGFEAINQKAE